MTVKTKLLIAMLAFVVCLGFAGSVNGMDGAQDNSAMELKEVLKQEKQKRKQERAETTTFIKLDAKKRFLSSAGILALGKPEEIQKKKIFGIIARSHGIRFSDQLRQAFKFAINDSSMVKIRNFNDRSFDYICKVYYIPGGQKTRWILELSRSQRVKKVEDGTVLK
jgi:hypothetical protein